jgi:hypothetical protein
MLPGDFHQHVLGLVLVLVLQLRWCLCCCWPPVLRSCGPELG